MLEVQWREVSLLVLNLGRNILVGSTRVHALLEPAFHLSLKRFDLLLEGVVQADLELLRHHVWLHGHHLHLLWHDANLLVEGLNESWLIHRDAVLALELVRVMDQKCLIAR